jgi:hypothetical protein
MIVCGDNDDSEYYGIRNNGQFQEFFRDFKNGDKIGAYLNKKKKTISYYRNGELLGVAFKKIKGKKFYAAVSTCHGLGGADLVVDFKPKKLPKSIRKSNSDSDDSDLSDDDSSDDSSDDSD